MPDPRLRTGDSFPMQVGETPLRAPGSGFFEYEILLCISQNRIEITQTQTNAITSTKKQTEQAEGLFYARAYHLYG
jgi:hypothetical protein